MNFKLNDIVVWLDPEMLTSAIFKIVDGQGSGFDTIYILQNPHSEIEATEDEMHVPETILVCKQCGHFHPEIPAWTDVNTSRYISEYGSVTEEVDTWCSQCEQKTGLVPANVFYALTIEDLNK